MKELGMLKESKNGVLTFTDIKQSSRILERLNECRTEEHLCDVILMVEGQRFPSHRSILMVASDYFKAMFSHQMRETSALEVPIAGLSPAALEQVLDYIYTGLVKVDKKELQDLIVASDMIQMDAIKHMCVSYLITSIKTSNCVELYLFGDMFHCESLVDKALYFIRSMYPAVSTTDDFLSLQPQHLSTIISHDRLSLEPEGEICVAQSILTWLDQDYSTRIQDVEAVLSHVRWRSLSTQVLDTVTSHPLIAAHPDLGEMITQAKSLCTSEPRPLRLVVGGGYLQSRTGPDCPRLCSVEALYLDDLIWHHKLGTIPLQASPPSFVHATMLAGQLLMFCLIYTEKEGRTDQYTTYLYRYNPLTDTWELVQCDAGLEDVFYKLYECARHRGVVISQHGTLYMVSWKEVHIAKLQYRDGCISVSDMKSLPDVPPGYNTSEGIHRQGMAAAICNKQLYSIGGMAVYSKTESCPMTDMYMWEESTQTWQQKADLIIPRSNMSAVVIGDDIYVTGGVNKLRLCSMERYNRTTDTWTCRRDMHKHRSFHMSVTAHGKIYVLGGKSYSYLCGGARKVLNTCEVYDPQTDVWSYTPQPMSHARCMATALIS